jgi:hypothetical protein
LDIIVVIKKQIKYEIFINHTDMFCNYATMHGNIRDKALL